MIKKNKRLLAAFLTIMLTTTMFPLSALATPEELEYWDPSANSGAGALATVQGPTVITSGSIELSSTGGTDDSSWYYVPAGEETNPNKISIGSRIIINGNVNIILGDYSTLTAYEGISVSESNSLTIWAQSTADATMGRLTADTFENDDGAGIGGDRSKSGGEITINGGVVNATSNDGAGIGGGAGGDGGIITINGGAVTAVSISGAGIGGGASDRDGNGSDGGIITINGGVITSESVDGSAIGGGGAYRSFNGGSGGSITINGGIVNAKSTGNGAAIGGGGGGWGGTAGSGGDSGIITISGGVVNACTYLSVGIGGGTGGWGSTAGNGGDGGTITISGGIINASEDGPIFGDASIVGSIGGGVAGGILSTTTRGDNGANSSGEFSGNAWIYTTMLNHNTTPAQAIVFVGLPEEETGTVYGSVALQEDFETGSVQALTIPGDASLTIPAALALTNNGILTIDGTLVIDGKLINNGIINGTGNIIVNGEIEAEDTVAVTYNPNTGDSTNDATHEFTVNLLPDMGSTIRDNTFTRSGYSFVDWNTAADGSADVYAANSTVKITTDITLYAQWKQNEPPPPPPPPPQYPDTSTPLTNIEEIETPLTDLPIKRTYSDVTTDDWFYEAVVYVSENGLMEGTGENKFSPNVSMSRAMLVTVLYRLDGSPEVSGEIPFPDVGSGKWYSDAILWASENNIIEGYSNGNFGINDLVTREQAVVILHRYAKMKELDISVTDDLSGYTDIDTVSDWALEAINWAIAEGIIQGRNAVSIAPKGTSSRAEVATILMRYVKDYLG